MSYFPDLSPYAYGDGSHPGVVHVGWLDGSHDYPKGRVPQDVVERLKVLATQPTELYGGFHVCEVCSPPERLLVAEEEEWWEWGMQRSSNGEIRVTFEGVTYAAPVLIVHNIEEHGYLPPEVFLRAVMQGVPNQPLGCVKTLPEDMLVSANQESDKPAWRLRDFPGVLERATAHRFVCFGGQLEFRGPIGMAEVSLPKVQPMSRLRGWDWDSYVELANQQILIEFRCLVKETDFRAEVRRWNHLAHPAESGTKSDLMEHLYFMAQFGRDPESEMASSPANFPPPGR